MTYLLVVPMYIITSLLIVIDLPKGKKYIAWILGIANLLIAAALISFVNYFIANVYGYQPNSQHCQEEYAFSAGHIDISCIKPSIMIIISFLGSIIFPTLGVVVWKKYNKASSKKKIMKTNI